MEDNGSLPEVGVTIEDTIPMDKGQEDPETEHRRRAEPLNDEEPEYQYPPELIEDEEETERTPGTLQEEDALGAHQPPRRGEEEERREVPEEADFPLLVPSTTATVDYDILDSLNGHRP